MGKQRGDSELQAQKAAIEQEKADKAAAIAGDIEAEASQELAQALVLLC